MAQVESEPTALVNTYRRMVQAAHESASAFISGMARRSQPILKHIGGLYQAIDIAVEGLANKELKTGLKKLLRQGKITTFEQCLAQTADLRDSFGLGHTTPTHTQAAEKPTYAKQARFQNRY